MNSRTVQGTGRTPTGLQLLRGAYASSFGAERGRVAGLEQVLHVVDRIGVAPVRFEQDLDAVVLDDAQRLVQLLADREERLALAQAAPERRW